VKGSSAMRDHERLTRFVQHGSSQAAERAAYMQAVQEHNTSNHYGVEARRSLRLFDEDLFLHNKLGDVEAQTAAENPRDHWLFGGPNPHQSFPPRIISAYRDDLRAVTPGSFTGDVSSIAKVDTETRI